MRPFSERLNDRLERQRRGAQPSGPSQSVLPGSDPKVEELAALAHRLQIAPHFQVDPGFAWRLESRILAHHAALSRRQAAATWGNWLFQPGRRMQFALGIVLVCLLLVATMGTFTAAAQVTNPYNPLYEVKRWVQHWQYPQINSATAQAEANWRTAHDQLHTLAGLADPAHAAAYHRALTALNQDIHTFARSIQTLPAGPDRESLANKLVTLKADARQTLRMLLPRLALPEQLLTTDELARLNDTVPHLESATVVVSHTNKQATITITGEHLQPGLHLLVDNHLVTANSSLQHDAAIFIMSWTGGQSPKTIAILNPDSTAGQTTNITFTITDKNGKDKGNNNATSDGTGNSHNSGNNGNGNGNSGGNNGNGNGNGKGKPEATPTPTP